MEKEEKKIESIYYNIIFYLSAFIKELEPPPPPRSVHKTQTIKMQSYDAGRATKSLVLTAGVGISQGNYGFPIMQMACDSFHFITVPMHYYATYAECGQSKYNALIQYVNNVICTFLCS